MNRCGCVFASAFAVLSSEVAAGAEPPTPWWLGAHANISADSANYVGWLLGLGIGARHPLRSWLDLQLRVYGTYRAPAWRKIEGMGLQTGVGDVSPSGEADTRVLAEATARWRPSWAGPLFVGAGPQVGVRVLPYSEIVATDARGNFSFRTGTDVQPVIRALVELGANFGPSDMFEVGVRLAVVTVLGKGPVERGNSGDGELGLAVGVLLPF